jgi:hypothetical protein
MLGGGIPRPFGPPNLPFPNPFSIDVHLLDKNNMRQHILYQFGFEAMTEMMRSNIPWVYPVVIYGREWKCTIFILF